MTTKQPDWAKLLAATPKFWKKVELPLSSDSCWKWLGKLKPEGYGAIMVDCKNYPAHRLAYILVKGPVPKGLHIDHLCRNRWCVNPNHLEAVTRKTNILRGIGPTAENARKDVCVRGHSLTGHNLYRQPIRKSRLCRSCANMHNRFYRAGLKAAKAKLLAKGEK